MNATTKNDKKNFIQIEEAVCQVFSMRYFTKALLQSDALNFFFNDMQLVTVRVPGKKQTKNR